MIKIKDLVLNREVDSYFLLANFKIALTSNNNKYITLLLKDDSGEVDAKIWDVNSKIIAILKKGEIYRIKGFVFLYRNNFQIKVNKIFLTNQNEINIDQFLELAPINTQKCFQEIIDCVAKFKNNFFKTIINYFLFKYQKQFSSWPAATLFHHNVKGGLLWHTFNMFKHAQSIFLIYKDFNINQELLLSGVILHDLGKIFEIENNNIFSYSLKGKLIGHISIMVSLLQKAAYLLKLENDENLILLQHMVLASHGKKEFGSPIEPHLLEAEILTSIDNLDAKIFAINKEISKTKFKEISKAIIPVESKWFLNHYQNNK